MMIVKVPGINSMGLTKGTRNAGNAVISEIKNRCKEKQVNFEEIHVDNNNLEEQNELICKNSKELFEEHDRAIFLGGDHSVSYSIGKAFLDYCNENDEEPFLIIFDAHADLCKSGKEPTHEEWLRGLIDKGFPIQNILLVGLRKTYKEEKEFLEEHKIRRIGVEQIKNNVEDAGDIITELGHGKKVYVSVDIDVVDPAFAPSTNYKEVGGLDSREIIYLIKRLEKMKNLIGLDIVEVDSVKDEEKDYLTVKLAAKLVEVFL